MKKQRNYTIEFLRIVLAINFCVVHVSNIVPPAFLGRPPYGVYTFDLVLIFMAISGYFLMQNFKKNQQFNQLHEIGAGAQAWGYLKSRLLSVGPIFLLAQLAGFVTMNLSTHLPLSRWPASFLNHLAEFFGLQLSGLGMGNLTDGVWGSTAPTRMILNTPMWFISGIFLCGYVIYYLLAKNEKHFTSLILPAVTVLFWASCYQADGPAAGVLMSPTAELFAHNGYVPIWNWFIHVGDLVFNANLVNMFIGLGVGCVIWVAVDRLKDKEWSGGMRIFMTVIQVICFALVMYRAWVPTNSEGYLLGEVGWLSFYLISLAFTFLTCLNADYLTQLLNRKVFDVPGRLSMYLYMFHFPAIVATVLILGVERASNIPMLIGMVIVESLIIATIIYLLDTKLVQPWMRKKPWYSRAQVAKEEEKALR